MEDAMSDLAREWNLGMLQSALAARKLASIGGGRIRDSKATFGPHVIMLLQAHDISSKASRRNWCSTLLRSYDEAAYLPIRRQYRNQRLFRFTSYTSNISMWEERRSPRLLLWLLIPQTTCTNVMATLQESLPMSPTLSKFIRRRRPQVSKTKLRSKSGKCKFCDVETSWIGNNQWTKTSMYIWEYTKTPALTEQELLQ